MKKKLFYRKPYEYFKNFSIKTGTNWLLAYDPLNQVIMCLSRLMAVNNDIISMFTKINLNLLILT